MKEKLRVVELFAGVGGFRLGLEGYAINGKSRSASSDYSKEFNPKYKVVFSNQWEPSSARSGELQEANMVYHYRWREVERCQHYPHDIGTIASPEMTNAKVKKHIPEHDLLVGGFPCQDYSVAGVNTKGMEGKKGVLWWNIHKILKARRPDYVFLENVDRLLKSPTTRRGRDFAIMLTTLNKLGYDVEWKVINAADYGMPQRRRRVYILAYHRNSKIHIKTPSSWCSKEGIFAKTFPSSSKGDPVEFKLDKDPLIITKQFKEGKFLNSGSMTKGKVWMTDFFPEDDGQQTSRYKTLGEVLQHPSEFNGEFVIDGKKKLKKPLEKIQQTGFEVSNQLKRMGDVIRLETEMDKWIYLKGRKAEQRTSSKGTFYYKEGPLKLYDPLDKASRTIITSEGGPGASRFKHLIKTKEGVIRRLTPVELERLNMFPSDHTSIGWDGEKEVKITPSKRAFFMGNALVVGVIEKVGIELSNRVK